jgi:hypothetical protein
MVKCLRAAALVFVAGNLCAAVPPASRQNEGAQLTVHEWGTFTSIAGPDGNAVPWRPHDIKKTGAFFEPGAVPRVHHAAINGGPHAAD